jgi:hypothetical protein
MFKPEDGMPAGAFKGWRDVQARKRLRKRTNRKSGEVGRVLVMFDRRCAEKPCNRGVFEEIIVALFPQLGPLDGEACDAALAECRRLARRVPEAVVEADPNAAVADLDDLSDDDDDRDDGDDADNAEAAADEVSDDGGADKGGEEDTDAIDDTGADALPPAPRAVAAATPLSLATPRDAEGAQVVPRHHVVAACRRYRDFVQQGALLRTCWAACGGQDRINATQLLTALTAAERTFAAARERRHASSGAQDIDLATALDILGRAASNGASLDKNDFLHALVLWRSLAKKRDRRVRRESACCALA